jgi:hypothetical protein
MIPSVTRINWYADDRVRANLGVFKCTPFLFPK